METLLCGVKPPHVIVLNKSISGRHANIVIDVFNTKEKKNKITAFSACEIMPDGRYRKNVSNRNIGLEYLYF